MKCPKCKSKLKKEYKYCYSCGLNISRNKLTSEIKSSIVLAVISMLIITGYPAIEYFKDTTSFVSLKTLFSSNPIETVLCNEENDNYVLDYDLKYKDKELKNYNVNYNFKSADSFNEYRTKLAKFKYETGINIIANDITNQISYVVDTISVVNDEIYDFNEIKYDYDEMKQNDKCK